MPTIEELHAQWRELGSDREKDRAVARALGGKILATKKGGKGGKNGKGERVRFGKKVEPLPHYVSNLADAQRAMDQAWMLMEESAPVRLVCHVAPRGGKGGRECRVEWWPDDGSHVVTPTFERESESRAFAVFAFAVQEGSVE